uniref:RNA binding protein n=1 Tax=Solanum tuberosum TaxID=4113 RepID=M1BZR0_SOLTU
MTRSSIIENKKLKGCCEWPMFWIRHGCGNIESPSNLGHFRGRFPSGGGSGYRNYGVRGRGNYGGGRGYARDDFGERTEFNNRGGHRGWPSNRGGDGYQSYQRTDNPGGYVVRTNRGGGMLNGTAKHIQGIAAPVM